MQPRLRKHLESLNSQIMEGNHNIKVKDIDYVGDAQGNGRVHREQDSPSLTCSEDLT
jgi:hypothetical protein